MDMDLDSRASLMRVTRFATTEDQETLVTQGTARALIAAALAMSAAEQEGLLLRASGADWSEDHDLDAIREIAASPAFTDAAGDWDTAERADDPDRAVVTDETIAPHGAAGTPADPPGVSETS